MDVQDVIDECERRVKILRKQRKGHFLDPDEQLRVAKIHTYNQVIEFIEDDQEESAENPLTAAVEAGMVVTTKEAT